MQPWAIGLIAFGSVMTYAVNAVFWGAMVAKINEQWCEYCERSRQRGGLGSCPTDHEGAGITIGFFWPVLLPLWASWHIVRIIKAREAEEA